ncbi:hypothetical protein Ga0100231_022385 [Opitutaceae bacterium TAV4]|nr:hypothetical protein Ga0100231_022385 [Opitutaceae bacterium TAV4]RRK00618.1 hypothetical protein Ga0100230_022605 [Opitutaceae bacterium TAV3]
MKHIKKNSLVNTIVLIAGLPGLAVTLPLHAAPTVEKTITIYTDDFDRTGTFAGSSPTIGAEAPTWAQGATWNASASLTFNTAGGGYIETPSATTANVRTAFLPVTMTENSGIYTFTITTSIQSGGNWALAAFSRRSPSSPTLDSDVLGDNVVSALYTPAGILTAYSGFGTLPGVTSSGAIPLTLSISIDTYKTTDNLTVKALNPVSATSIVGTLTKTQYEAIRSLRIGNNNTEARFYDMSLTLTTVTAIPEPATWSVIIGMAALFACLATRRFWK